jgi:hypothetical protein
MKSRAHVAVRLLAIVALTGSSLLGACSTKDAGVRASSSDSARNTAGSLEGPTRADSAKSAASMPGMPAAQGGQPAGAATTGMDSMQAHLHSMQAMSSEQMKASLPAHRQMVANMLSDLNGEMRKMNMPADASWTALSDSVRKDLVQMPDMSATELRSSLPDHAARITRLMAMHRTMMAGMKM